MSLLPPSGFTAADLAAVERVQADREARFAASEPGAPAKPRWARRATVKAPFAPERDRPGTRFAAPVPRGTGPRKRFAAT